MGEDAKAKATEMLHLRFIASNIENHLPGDVALAWAEYKTFKEGVADDIARALITKHNDMEKAITTIETADAWLARWAQHVGRCNGGDRCTCGLTAIRYEIANFLAQEN